MCIIYPPDITPIDTLLVDRKQSKHTRSLIYRNNIKKIKENVLMGFLINGELLNIKTSYLDDYIIYSKEIEKEFMRLGLSILETDNISSYKTFENKDFVVKSIKIEEAENYIKKMIKDFKLTEEENNTFNKTFLNIVKNYQNTFFLQKTFSNLNFVIVKFKKTDNVYNFNTIELLYEKPEDKFVIVPTAHEIFPDGYTYYVNGYVDDVKDIHVDQFKYFSNGNEKAIVKKEYKDKNNHSFIFSMSSVHSFKTNKKYNLPLNMFPYSINGFSKNEKIFYMRLNFYDNIFNLNFYLEVF